MKLQAWIIVLALSYAPISADSMFRLPVKYFGDPAVHWTDGWHQYTMQKEADGRWHQCRYTFELMDEQ